MKTYRSKQENIQQLIFMFLKLGITGFGGPQAHIASINQEAVVKKNWLTQEEFTEGLAICEMLPGPASTQMGIYTGYSVAGLWGGAIAGLCFIAPAFLIVLALSWTYFRFQGVPQIDALFLGISPVISAIIINFYWNLGKKNLSNWLSRVIALSVLLGTILGNFNITIQLIVAGLIGLYFYGYNRPNRKINNMAIAPFYLINLPPSTLTLASFWGWERISEFGLPLTLFFLKVGSLIFGGGLVIIPLLEFEVVEKLQWLTRDEFINGVAIGQISPGPVVLTAAFIGYKVAGCLGALLATIGIFTPSFIFIFLAAPLLEKIRKNELLKGFLKGVTPAVVGAIAAVSLPIIQQALIHEKILQSLGTGVIFVLALTALQLYKTPTWQLIALGAFLGLLIGTL
jgi:chromate transporter